MGPTSCMAHLGSLLLDKRHRSVADVQWIWAYYRVQCMKMRPPPTEKETGEGMVEINGSDPNDRVPFRHRL